MICKLVYTQEDTEKTIQPTIKHGYEPILKTVVEVKNVYKSFNSVHAVRGIDLTVCEGEFVSILGPNGAGKTTLVEMIEGIQTPDSGEILVMDLEWNGNEETLHRILGISLQETRFIDRLTVKETLKLFASFYDLGKNRVFEIMDIVNLREKADAYTVNLSGGQRQRLALGIALLNQPKILMLDEPTTGLDPNARRDIWSILLDLKTNSNTSLILTTHYMEEAEQLCDDVMIIDQGKVLREGTIDQLLSEESEEKIISFSLEAPYPYISDLDYQSPFHIKWDQGNYSGSISVSDMESQLPIFFDFLNSHNMRIKNFECRRRTLDDLFTSMTGRRLHE